MRSGSIRERVIDRINGLRKKSAAPLKILDIGGGFYPFAQATHIVDLVTYEQFEKIYSSKMYNKAGIWGGEKPQFSESTWVVHDISSGTQLPFPDKYFDFCVCCHLLEDLINPFQAIAELNRVAKAGYIETPSKEYECTRGIDGVLGRLYTGFNHHFWMFTIAGDQLVIEPKYSFISSSSCFQFPGRYRRKWEKANTDIVSYYWENRIEYRFPEMSLFNDLRMKQIHYIRQKGCYRLSMLFMDAYNYLKKLRNRVKFGL